MNNSKKYDVYNKINMKIKKQEIFNWEIIKEIDNYG